MSPGVVPGSIIWLKDCNSQKFDQKDEGVGCSATDLATYQIEENLDGTYTIDDCNNYCATLPECESFQFGVSSSNAQHCRAFKAIPKDKCDLYDPDWDFYYLRFWQVPDTTTVTDHCTHKSEFNSDYGIV
jgi:hypothetical protein